MTTPRPLRDAPAWIGSFAVLIAFQLIGMLITALIGWQIPGAVVGLVLLAGALLAGRRGRVWRQERVAPAADSLLEVLPLLFVPAGVGVVSYLPQLGENLLAVVVALAGSWAVTLLSTGGLLQLLLGRPGRRATRRVGPR